MPKRLRRMSGREAIRILEKLGIRTKRQRGSHVVLRKANKGCVVPLHDELAEGTLHSILKQAGITIDEFEGAGK